MCPLLTTLLQPRSGRYRPDMSHDAPPPVGDRNIDGGIDVERLRRETPGLTRRIHLNHAGASPSPDAVVDTVVEHLRLEAELGGYEAAELAAPRLQAARTSVATLLGCAPTDVAFTAGATDAWQRVFWSFPWQPGDVVLVGRSEYVANALALLRAERAAGVRVEVVDDDASGQIDVGALEQRLRAAPVALVSLVHVPTSSGLVNPAAAVGAVCRAAGVPLLLDACQSVGQLPTDVEELGCDALTATGRKFLRGPRGTGFLYVRRTLLDRLDPLFVDGNSATWTSAREYELSPGALRFEAFERNHAALLGLGRAVDDALELGLDAIAERVTALGTRLRALLQRVPGVQVRDPGSTRCGIVTFTVDGHTALDVRNRLAADGVQVWTSSAVHAQLDLPHRDLHEVVRASVHYVTTDDELDRTAELVAGISGARRA